MYIRNVVYKDYDGNERKEDFYFNISEAELTEMSLSVNGGLNKKLQKIIDAKDTASSMVIFKELLKTAYGEKSLDGRKFIKNEEVYNNFAQTEAYSIIFMDLCTNSKSAAEFVKNVLPERIAKDIDTSSFEGNVISLPDSK